MLLPSFLIEKVIGTNITMVEVFSTNLSINIIADSWEKYGVWFSYLCTWEGPIWLLLTPPQMLGWRIPEGAVPVQRAVSPRRPRLAAQPGRRSLHARTADKPPICRGAGAQTPWKKCPGYGRRPGTQKQLPATQREPFSLGFLEGAGRLLFPLCGPASVSALMPPGFAVPARNFIAVMTWCFAVSPQGAGTVHIPAAAAATFPSLPRSAARPGAPGPQPPCPNPDRPPAAAHEHVRSHAACSSGTAGTHSLFFGSGRDTQPAAVRKWRPAHRGSQHGPPVCWAASTDSGNAVRALRSSVSCTLCSIYYLSPVGTLNFLY